LQWAVVEQRAVEVAVHRAEPTVKVRQISQVVKAAMAARVDLRDQVAEQAVPRHCS
jgi:hypothetical protein